MATNTIHLRTSISDEGLATFSYSTNGRRFKKIDTPYPVIRGHWIGAKVGLFNVRQKTTNDSGYADFDYFRFSK